MPRAGSTDPPEPSAVVHRLRGLHFPASKQQLLDHARASAPGRDPEHVVEMLDRLPERGYDDLTDVERAVDEHRRGQ